MGKMTKNNLSSLRISDESPLMQQANNAWFKSIALPLDVWVNSPQKEKILCIDDCAEELKYFFEHNEFHVDFISSDEIPSLEKMNTVKNSVYCMVCAIDIKNLLVLNNLKDALLYSSYVLKSCGILALGFNGIKNIDERSIISFFDQNNNYKPFDPNLIPLISRFYGFERGVIKKNQQDKEERFWKRPIPSYQDADIYLAQKRASEDCMQYFDEAFLATAEDTVVYHGEAHIRAYQKVLLEEERKRVALENKITKSESGMKFYRDRYNKIEKSFVYKIVRKTYFIDELIKYVVDKIIRRLDRFSKSYDKRVLRLCKSLLKKKWIRKRQNIFDYLIRYQNKKLDSALHQGQYGQIRFATPDFLMDPKIQKNLDTIKEKIAGQR